MPVPRPLLVFAGLLLLIRVGLGLYEWKHPVVELSAVEWLAAPAAQAKAESDDRLLLYYFGADWCAPCKRLKREVFSDPDFGALVNGAYLPVHVEDGLESDGLSDEEAGALRRCLGVDSFPTLLVVRGEEVVARVVGYSSREKHLKWIRASLVAAQ